ncbi:MAG: hypothetical protein AB7P76_09065 [Candidatus Melainabacteria bacterium]
MSEAIVQSLPEGFHPVAMGGEHFCRKPLAGLPAPQACDLIDKLFSPDERFAKAFFKYWSDVLKHPENLAWKNTIEELETYATALKNNLADPYVYSVGYLTDEQEPESYVPVGIYAFRPLEDHQRGPEIIHVLDQMPSSEQYEGRRSMMHTFSLLKDYRNLHMLKYIFVTVGFEALRQGYQHIFFFMSDYRLKSVYKRYGLEFPENLKFEDTHHTIGVYSLTDANIAKIMAVINAS